MKHIEMLKIPRVPPLSQKTVKLINNNKPHKIEPNTPIMVYVFQGLKTIVLFPNISAFFDQSSKSTLFRCQTTDVVYFLSIKLCYIKQ